MYCIAKHQFRSSINAKLVFRNTMQPYARANYLKKVPKKRTGTIATRIAIVITAAGTLTNKSNAFINRPPDVLASWLRTWTGLDTNIGR